MEKDERLQLILDYLNRDQRVLLTELSEKLNVSEDTVRRDIKVLADQKLLTAVRGGAIPHSPIPFHYRAREKRDLTSKKIIAQKALSFLQDGQVVFFDGGTTTQVLAENLPKDLHITIVTNSFPIAAALEDHPCAELIFAGGRLFKPSFITVGNETLQTFRQIRADLCISGICSIHPEIGITSNDQQEAEIKKTMLSMSTKTIALTTTDKINTAEAFLIGAATQLHTIITNGVENDPMFTAYQKLGIEVI